ncbi:DMT family transporter [Methylobacterium sp. NEAU 140]|uniref:DMT family transporter n=1 Tax=Methylobacterium sp. NEAU 140 TaxID=3064945 RepID=UPI002732CAE5|nr:DMT family transporter [Methylobacterium sp. NEAU 140]MDP4026533.1 DMT family transporter [Methylobacterium sp. NEAU 140]
METPLNPLRGYALLSATAVGWALNWPLIKVILRDWPPLFARGLAGLVAALLLAGVARAAGEDLRVPVRALPRLCFAAYTNVFAWMGFATLAMTWLRAGETVLLVYSMPLWATLFAWPILGVRPTRTALTALGLGLAGLVLLVAGPGFSAGPGTGFGILFALASAASFALGTVLNRTAPPLRPLAAVAWQVGLGSAPMLALGLAFEAPHPGALAPAGWAAFAYMVLVPMSACYVTWFATLRALPAPTAATGMLLVPVLGTLSAALALGEPLGWRELAAMGLTLGGVAIALRRA